MAASTTNEMVMNATKCAGTAGAAVGGMMSVVENFDDLQNGNKEIREEAQKRVAKDVVTGAVVGKVAQVASKSCKLPGAAGVAVTCALAIPDICDKLSKGDNQGAAETAAKTAASSAVMVAGTAIGGPIGGLIATAIFSCFW